RKHVTLGIRNRRLGARQSLAPPRGRSKIFFLLPLSPAKSSKTDPSLSREAQKFQKSSPLAANPSARPSPRCRRGAGVSRPHPPPAMEAVVVDAGSKLLKAGIALPDQAPGLVMPSKMKTEVEENEVADGAAAVVEEVVQPVVRGFVKDWDAMEDLLTYVLYRNIGWEMGDEGQILFTQPLFTPKALREQLVQLMFEKFNVSGFYDSEQAVLSLYAVGRISGCTVDIGHGKIG
uniref:Actin-related protein 7 n=1 Tax=Aegilops tauschii subsp. strangulata TaxID=200361 RepID=A0A453LZC4_AEGTS